MGHFVLVNNYIYMFIRIHLLPPLPFFLPRSCTVIFNVSIQMQFIIIDIQSIRQKLHIKFKSVQRVRRGTIRIKQKRL